MSCATQLNRHGTENPKKPEQDRQKNSHPAAAVDAHDSGGNTAPDSRIRILYPPNDLVAGNDCASRVTTMIVSTKATDLKGPLRLEGTLVDKDSLKALPANYLELQTPPSDGTKCDGDPLKQDTISPSSPTSIQIKLSESWHAAGNFAGTLALIAPGDAGAQAIRIKVSVRGLYSWIIGSAAILFGTLLWWFATVWIARVRQRAGNEILVSRLQGVLDGLVSALNQLSVFGAPLPEKTLIHIKQVRDTKLRQLLEDKELAVIAGVTVPAIGTISVMDEIEGLSHITQIGFSGLLDLWNRNDPAHEQLKTFFSQMDTLGDVARPLNEVDQTLKTILAGAQGAVGGQKVAASSITLPQLPKEEAIVHRVLFSSFILDFVSVLTIVALGVYLLICKNPGFGSASDMFVAFFWGLGLKLGTDAGRLGPGDVRTAYSIKIPSAGV